MRTYRRATFAGSAVCGVAADRVWYFIWEEPMIHVLGHQDPGHDRGGSIEFENITTRKEEFFYWLTILVSNTLGTALGDYLATDAGLGFERGALVFAILIGIVGSAHFWLKRIPPSVLFWSAYVLTRPLGATLGDTLTKSHDQGGLALGRFASSLTILVVMIVAVFLVSRKKSVTSPALQGGTTR